MRRSQYWYAMNRVAWLTMPEEIQKMPWTKQHVWAEFVTDLMLAPTAIGAPYGG